MTRSSGQKAPRRGQPSCQGPSSVLPALDIAQHYLRDPCLGDRLRVDDQVEGGEVFSEVYVVDLLVELAVLAVTDGQDLPALRHRRTVALRHPGGPALHAPGKPDLEPFFREPGERVAGDDHVPPLRLELQAGVHLTVEIRGLLPLS